MLCLLPLFADTMIHIKLINYFYPELSVREARKYWLLSLIFVVIVGTYWLLRPLKNTIFLKIAFPECFGWDPQQGCLFQTYAKTWSPFVVFFLLLAYSKLIDLIKPHQLFYVFAALFSSCFALFAVLLGIREIYGVTALGKPVLASLGWVSYTIIESYGSLLVAFFWSFCNSISDTESAEHGFPLIIALAQVSALVGSSLLFFPGSDGSLWLLMLIAAGLVAMLIPLVRYFMGQMRDDPLVIETSIQEPTDTSVGFWWGAFEGMYMLATRPYLFGILIISVVYDAVSVILDYQMNAYASSSPLFSGELAFARFQSMYGIGVGLVSLFVALFVTSSLLTRFGTRVGLLVYPLLFTLSLAGLLGCFYAGVPTNKVLWVFFGVMVLTKGVGYSLNSPVIEMMFITTSKQANYKSNAWIDTFASRFAKAGGSSVVALLQHSMTALMLYGSLTGLGLVAVWVVAAVYVGYRNRQLRERNQIVT